MTQTTERPRPQQPAQRPQLRLPERPKLADGVKLAGQMRESAFVDPPWLLEREDAGYIQVTELLYQIAEQCDGQHTLAQIAEVVSDKSGRSVTEDNVKLLVTKQLVPRGLIEVPGLELPKVEAGARSPLALNMRVRMLGPETVTPVTRVLSILYWPPVLVGILVLTAVVEAWVYFVHGVGTSIHDALYQPGLMAIVLLSIILAAAFHELGHAAALHYAGGRIKGMGAGVYIVYPAFFTDVSDNYRLPRWSRVRTDLGGFYFNLLFALAVVGLYVLTHQEVLLLLVVLINLEIFHQLLPFLRLDGYWTLADVTGVPDFFSQMAAFVRSVLPNKRVEGRKLPELKRWAKVVFALYMLVTIPLLAVLLLLMVKSVPRVLATAWDSFGKLGQGFVAAQSQGDFLAMGGAVLQVLLLALPVAGLCYTLFSLARRLITGIWNWSKPTMARRVVGSVGMLGAAALLGFMWAPQLPLGIGGGAPGPMYDQVRFEPIGDTERGTVQDAVANVVATREPTAAPTPGATPGPTVEGTPEPFVGRGSEATPQTVATATAEAQEVATAAPVVTPVRTAAAVQATVVRATAVATARAVSGTATPTVVP